MMLVDQKSNIRNKEMVMNGDESKYLLTSKNITRIWEISSIICLVYAGLMLLLSILWLYFDASIPFGMGTLQTGILAAVLAGSFKLQAIRWPTRSR